MCREEVQFLCQIENWRNGTNANKLKFTWSIENTTVLEEMKQGPDQSSALTMEEIANYGIARGNFEVYNTANKKTVMYSKLPHCENT